MRKITFINNKTGEQKARLINENGEQLGIVSLSDAFQKAKEKNLDLIQITEKANPPVYKIGDFGKYLYWQKKKEKGKISHNVGEMKNIRLSFNISNHDLEIKAKQTEKFLRKNDKIRIELRLKGREKALEEIGREKIKRFLEIINILIPIKIEKELKKEARGFTIIISKE